MFTTLISTTELADLLQEKSVVLFDCRFDLNEITAGRDAFDAAHIPGALYAHLEDDLSSRVTVSSGRHPLPNVDQFLSWLGNQGVSPDSQVVVYDDMGGAMAARLWWLLKWVGHKAVALLDGGYHKWLRDRLEITAGSPAPMAFEYLATPDNSLWLTSEQVSDALASEEILLVDARMRERYRGDEEPLDIKAGHIPGAMNMPFKDNLSEKGCFRRVDDLNKHFSSIPSNTKKIVHMCGSGVTACHNIIAMEHAGIEGSKLYAGSWSEWITVDTRPIVLGK
jgi:thiosulfate/3-mercaptopyruvate sulfurtransferase